MATIKSPKSSNGHIFPIKSHKNMINISICMFSDTRKPNLALKFEKRDCQKPKIPTCQSNWSDRSETDEDFSFHWIRLSLRFWYFITWRNMFKIVLSVSAGALVLPALKYESMSRWKTRQQRRQNLLILDCVIFFQANTGPADYKNFVVEPALPFVEKNIEVANEAGWWIRMVGIV